MLRPPIGQAHDLVVGDADYCLVRIVYGDELLVGYEDEVRVFAATVLLYQLHFREAEIGLAQNRNAPRANKVRMPLRNHMRTSVGMNCARRGPALG